MLVLVVSCMSYFIPLQVVFSPVHLSFNFIAADNGLQPESLWKVINACLSNETYLLTYFTCES